MDKAQAQKIIESLRQGIPPNGHVRQFTVGREDEIKSLESSLSSEGGGALLIKANYGSGKTHLLRYIREFALEQGFVVSYVTLDARSAIRFNRMDQILGAICRGIEISESPGVKGVRPFFNSIVAAIERARTNSHPQGFWSKLTNSWQWDYSDVLDSPALFIALRAWATAEPDTQDLVEDWLQQPWQYVSKRKPLYQQLVEELRKYFRDPRHEFKFYDVNEGIFNFRLQSYTQSWACLRDLHKLAIASGKKGLLIIFDEFEDVIHNIKNISHKQAAFWNLFEFYSGKPFPGKSFYAVTPEFVQKCKAVLLEKSILDFDYSRFERLPTFQMSPLEVKELQLLALKIMEIHGLAYDWKPEDHLKLSDLNAIVKTAASIQIQDRARHTITEVVKYLDRTLDRLDD